MPAHREAIFSALFDRIKAIDGFNYASRRFISWDDTPPPAQPAFFLVKSNEGHEPRTRLPPQIQLEAKLFIYCRNDDRDAAPSSQLNDLLEAIEQALQLQPSETPTGPLSKFATQVQGYTWGTTLGGLCHQCQIEGTVEIFEGVIAGVAEAIVPIVIWTTGW